MVFVISQYFIIFSLFYARNLISIFTFCKINNHYSLILTELFDRSMHCLTSITDKNVSTKDYLAKIIQNFKINVILKIGVVCQLIYVLKII